MILPNAHSFYEEQYRGSKYAASSPAREEVQRLEEVVSTFGLNGARALEVGCGRGDFRHVIARWTGIDLAVSLGFSLGKRFAAASADQLPFQDESFDFIWSITVLEHVPDVEAALNEIVRVLRPGGFAYLAPAWHCRPWAADGIAVRPWRELTRRERMVKLTIPLRESLLVRGTAMLLVRLFRELMFAFTRRKVCLFYGRLKPNYTVYWGSDSDACNSLDPHEFLLWFRSRGFTSPSHDTFVRRMSVRHGAILVRKN